MDMGKVPFDHSIRFIATKCQFLKWSGIFSLLCRLILSSITEKDFTGRDDTSNIAGVNNYSAILATLQITSYVHNLNNTAPSIGTFAGRGLERSQW